jgi:hypothetical protein
MWASDRFNGQGTYTWPMVLSIQEIWKDDVQDGYGIFFYTNGDSIQDILKTTSFMGKENIHGPMAQFRRVSMKTVCLKNNIKKPN